VGLYKYSKVRLPTLLVGKLNEHYKRRFVINIMICILQFYQRLPLYICGVGVEPGPLLQRPFIGLLYQPCLIDADDCEAINGINEWQVKPKYSDKTCSNAALSTTDPHDFNRGSNLGRRGGNPATKHWATARHGTARPKARNGTPAVLQLISMRPSSYDISCTILFSLVEMSASSLTTPSSKLAADVPCRT
jgi:hypothetical protein